MNKLIDQPGLRERLHIFEDRFHAGELLADMLKKHIRLENAVILAIPAGGVPVGYQISRKLNLPMDVMIVRKLQIPWDPEAGFGAISWDGEMVLNEQLIKRLGLSRDLIEEAVKIAMKIIQDRIEKFKVAKPISDLRGKSAILVDDGLASGYTMLAAIKSVKKKNPRKIIIAVPTASTTAIQLISKEVDKLLCLNLRSSPFFAVADAYQNWRDLMDKEVIDILRNI